MVCRLDLRPHTIRQSWDRREQEFLRLCREEKRQSQSVDETRLLPHLRKGAASASSCSGDADEYDRATKRALLDLATCHGQAVDTRVAVLAFLTEALASQPGLADWLFDSNGDFPGFSTLSSEAGGVEGATKNSIELDRRAVDKDGYYNGWIVEIRGGKGLGQPPLVVSSYDGKTKTATLSKGWDAKYDIPDKTSQYLISKQLQLRRIIKAFLHPDVPFSGGPGPSSERVLNRLKIMEHTFMLIETVWDTAPEERAGIVQGFSDSDCLIWGLASPDGGKVVNKTSRWREYTMRLHVSGDSSSPVGNRKSFRVVAAPSDPYAEICDSTGEGGRVPVGRVVTKGPQKDPKVLGWIRPEEDSDGGKASESSGFWDTIQRYALGSDVGRLSTSYVSSFKPPPSSLSIEWEFWDEGCRAGGLPSAQDARLWEQPTTQCNVVVRVKMPSTMRRKILPVLDVDECKLLAFLKDPKEMKKACDAMVQSECHSIARQMYSDLRHLAANRNQEELLERVNIELKILDFTLQEMEASGIDAAERVDVALDQMWGRLRFGLIYTAIGQDEGPVGADAKKGCKNAEKPLPPVRLPVVLRKWLFDSLLEEGTAEKFDDLWAATEGRGGVQMPPHALTDAVECECRRLHIEALAVSVCALHLEEGDGGGVTSGGEDEWGRTRIRLTRRLTKKALLELTYLDKPQQCENTLDDDMWLRGLQQVAMVLPDNKAEGQIRHRQRVEYKLKTLQARSREHIRPCKNVHGNWPKALTALANRVTTARLHSTYSLPIRSFLGANICLRTDENTLTCFLYAGLFQRLDL